MSIKFEKDISKFMSRLDNTVRNPKNLLNKYKSFLECFFF